MEQELASLVGPATDDQLDALDGHVDVIRAMTHGINAATLLQGLKILEYLGDLPVEGIADIAEARNEVGPFAWEAIARCVVKVGEDNPLDTPVWGDASPVERARFLEAFTYARSLVGSTRAPS
ncbi:hypothetical protein [Sphaerisporangium perillae]|uniref:hypothetical protein n=1 Tax=Sphaerisporangium perillae TaxID=2935860 RepID=UPI00200FBC66|nr:hypothetical protein [Sphaerisporangium perillae]